MGERVARTLSAIAVVAVVASACSGDAGPTTTQFIPPTSEIIFEAPTTTTQAPGPLDPVFIESLGITVDIPRDWEFETESLRFGRASAAFRAENDSGGLIVVGAVSDVLPWITDPDEVARELAPIVATLFNALSALPLDAVRRVEGPTAGEANGLSYDVTTFEVVEESGAVARIQIAIYESTDPLVFIAVLYQDGFPVSRIEQSRVFDTVTAG